MPFDGRMKATFEKAKSIAARLDIELKAGGSGGGSDANFVAPLGIPVLDGLGAVGEGYHSEREYIFADSVEQKVKLVASLLRSW
jgi:glutamate carboxypeptidase